MKAKYIDFFLGANTSKGFVSRYEQISENSNLKKIYVIKGGPGTGKSTVMRKIAESCNGGSVIERIHCSSDPDSLDSVIDEKRGFAVLDGTPPHPMEPKYPGAFETIVNLYPCWNEKKLEKDLEKIKTLVMGYTECHKKACGYIKIISALLKDNMRVANECTKFSKIEKYVKGLLKRELQKNDEESGKENVRFFSAITPNGVKQYNITIETLCEKAYVIEDDIGVVSNYILKAIKREALAQKFDVISGYCVTDPFEKLEHIIIPQLKLAFVTSNKFHKISLSIPQKHVKASRFTDLGRLNERKQYISFNKKAAKSFLDEAVKLMKTAKEQHDVLEKIYISAVDFEKVDRLGVAIVEEIKKEEPVD